MDWNHWQPKERATLCFIVESDQVLLIEKKRGLGAGKVNGPGGKVEPGESLLQTAIRETQEEIGVTPLAPVLRAELSFQFTDGYSLFCAVFVADDHLGHPVSTVEADPFWSKLDAIPYERMWQDDALWLPQVLAGEKLRGFFIFDSDGMLEHHLEPLAH